MDWFAIVRTPTALNVFALSELVDSSPLLMATNLTAARTQSGLLLDWLFKIDSDVQVTAGQPSPWLLSRATYFDWTNGVPL